MTRRAEPRDIVESPVFLCRPGRKRRCETFVSLRCNSCGWWGVKDDEPSADEGLTLFPVPEQHSQEHCDRRQLDPEYRMAEDRKRLEDAVVVPPSADHP